MTTVFFALAAALGVLLWFVGWWRNTRARDLRRAAETALTPEAPAGESPAPEPRKAARWEYIALAALCAVYGVTAFAGLGDTEAPQSFLHFPAGNYYAMVEFSEPEQLASVMWYGGLNTGEYTLQYSSDGETWRDIKAADGSNPITQEYTQVFCWSSAALDTAEGPTRYVRLVSSAELWLGELVFFRADGTAVSAEEMTAAPGCEALFDEQELCPEKSSYLNGTYFDEIYHPRTAYEHLQGVWPYEITHPPLGKIILGLGIRLFGMTPFGWRFSGTLLGVLMLPLLWLLLRKMTRSAVAALCGTVIFAFDFMHFTQTRLATIDTYAVFFILAMYLFMYLWLTEKKRRALYLALCGVSFGLGAASKWVCLYAGAGLAVLWALAWIMRLRREKRAALAPLGKNILWCLLFFVAVPAAIYYASYVPYGRAQGLSGIKMLFSADYARLVWDNQQYMWRYHSGLVATHPYSSRWYQWLTDARPILYYLEYFGNGTKSVIACFNNPLLCWGGLLAMAGMVYLAVKRRSERAVFVLVGYLANLLPWVLVSRLTFAYHYFPCSVFLVLALGLVFADDMAAQPRRRARALRFTGACVYLFVLFYPVLSGARVSEKYTEIFLRWFSDSWPI